MGKALTQVCTRSLSTARSVFSLSEPDTPSVIRERARSSLEAVLYRRDAKFNGSYVNIGEDASCQTDRRANFRRGVASLKEVTSKQHYNMGCKLRYDRGGGRWLRRVARSDAFLYTTTIIVHGLDFYRSPSLKQRCWSTCLHPPSLDRILRIVEHLESQSPRIV